MPQLALFVNGVRRETESAAGMPLLWYLRDVLGLTGTKYGCGEGVCGACTVLEEGVAVRACQIDLAAAAGKSYTTIEGLSADGSHPVQRAWLEESVAQCGYCQPGMIVEIAALLARTPAPTPAEVESALGDHLCRCGSYPRVRKAVDRASGRAGDRKAGGGR